MSEELTDLQEGSQAGAVADEKAGAQGGLNSQIGANGSQGEGGEPMPKDEGKGGANDEGQEEPPAENELIGKPDAYSIDNIELPEGIELNQEVLKSFDEFASLVNLSQKGYGKAVDMGIKLVEETKARMLESFKVAEEQKILGYQRATFNDKEIGGEKLQQSISEAASAYRKFATPDVQEIFAQSGLEHHPAVIKMFRRISAEMDDDTFAGGGSGNATEIPLEQKMFPDMFRQ